MSTTDIIPGIALTARCMTEVMEYIKKQDEEIKKLKQENGEIMDSLDKELGVERNLARDVRILVEENEELKTSIQTTTSYWTDSNELLKDEIKKLKKGNETYEDLLAGEKGLIDEINKLKEEKDGYFQAWLYYWSGGSQGKEHKIPMSEIEDGKYQKILEDEDDT